MNTNPSSQPSLKIVVVGGSGLIGKPLVRALRDHGHTVVVASATTATRSSWPPHPTASTP